MDERLLVGVVVGAHGLTGQLRVKSFTQRPADVAAYGPVEAEAEGSAPRRLRLRVTGEGKGFVLARVDGVADRNAADALKGARLFVPRAALPAPGEDEFYSADLLGLAAEDGEGRALGRVSGLFDFGAGEVIEIDGPGGRQMLPFTRATVPVVDIAGGRVVVAPPATVGDEDEAEEARAEESDARA